MPTSVRSLWNKLDELHGNVSCQWVYKDAGLIWVMETWLDSTIADSQLSLSGFGTPVRLDQDIVNSQKRHGEGGGICVYVNQAWSRTATLIDPSCSADVELLALTFRPKHLPHEFGHLVLMLVNIPSSGDAR